MSLASIPFIFSAGQTIIASQHNSNFSTIYNVVNGGLDNSNLSAGAGIVYTKLYLAGQLINTDISPTAAIDGSKLANSGIDLTTKVTGVLPIANGGTGSATASLVGGTAISISGTFPNQTVTSTYTPVSYFTTQYDVHSSRSIGSTYTNSSGVPMIVTATIRTSSNNDTFGILTGTTGGIVFSVYIAGQSTATYQVGTMSLMVPNGNTYQIAMPTGGNSPVIISWVETY